MSIRSWFVIMKKNEFVNIMTLNTASKYMPALRRKWDLRQIVLCFRKTLAMDEVNDLAYEPFIALFGSIIEHCSLCAAAVWQNRPFRDVHHIHQLICDLLDKLPDSGQWSIVQHIMYCNL